MAHQVIRQPNGKYCIYSSILDFIICSNFEPEDVLEFWLEYDREKYKERLKSIISKIDKGEAPYGSFTVSFDHALNESRANMNESDYKSLIDGLKQKTNASDSTS